AAILRVAEAELPGEVEPPAFDHARLEQGAGVRVSGRDRNDRVRREGRRCGRVFVLMPKTVIREPELAALVVTPARDPSRVQRRTRVAAPHRDRARREVWNGRHHGLLRIIAPVRIVRYAERAEAELSG